MSILEWPIKIEVFSIFLSLENIKKYQLISIVHYLAADFTYNMFIMYYSFVYSRSIWHCQQSINEHYKSEGINNCFTPGYEVKKCIDNLSYL